MNLFLICFVLLVILLNNSYFYFITYLNFSHTFLFRLGVYKISMSFISGIEQDITNFFSGASDTFSGVVNFGSNIVNGVQNAIQGVIHSIANIAQGIYNGILSIGSDIASIFGQLGSAIWHGLVSFATSFGTFFYEAFHIVASAVYGAFQRVANAFEYIGKWIWGGIVHIGDALHGVGEWLYNGFREIGYSLMQLPVIFGDIYADIKNFFATIWNGLLTVGGDILNALTSFASHVENLFNGAIDYVGNIFNDLKYAPEDVSKYVTSKIASALPKVASYNLFFEEMKSLDRLAENMAKKKTLAPILLKIGSPFIAGFTSLIAESAINSFFPEITSVGTSQRTQVNTPPKSSVTSKISIPNPFQPVSPSYTPPTVTQPPSASVQLKSAQTFEKYVVGVRENDEEILTALPTVSNKLVSPYPNSVTAIDQLSIDGYIAQITREFISFSETDSVYVLPYAQLKINKVSEQDNVDVSFAGGVSVQTYLLGVPICLPPANNAPVSSISGAINEGIDSSIQVCLEIGNIIGNSVSAPTSLFNNSYIPAQHMQSDTITASISVFSSPYIPAQYIQSDTATASVSPYSG